MNFENCIGLNSKNFNLKPRRFVNRNPSNLSDIIGRFPLSGRKEVDHAVRSAEAALSEWMNFPAPKKAEILLGIASLFEERKTEVALLMAREMGKTISEAIAEVQEVIDTARYYHGEGRRLGGVHSPSELRDKLCMAMRMPIGICGLITPWNFPVAVPSWKIFPALILGNSLVWKPSEDAPASANLFYQICQQAGLPNGVLNVVHGGGETGKLLVEHKKIKMVSFTGSSQVGSGIAQYCAKNHKRYSLEMGGKNAQIVMPDASLALALEGAIWGAFGTSGQRCTATSRVLLHKKVFKLFLDKFVSLASRLVVGSPENHKTSMGPIINARQMSRIDRYIRMGLKEGARLVLDGRSKEFKSNMNQGFFMGPCIFDHVKPSMRIAQEEIFGPVVCLIQFSSFDEAVEIANATKYGLSSSIYSKNIRNLMSAMKRLEAGITYLNGPTIGAEVHMPFGGVKATGSGHREAGATSLDIFSEWKTVYWDYSDKLQKAQVD